MYLTRVVPALALLALFCFAGTVQAQTTGPYLGTWTLVSQEAVSNGQTIKAFGDNPRGQLMLTADGRFSIIFMRTSLPKVAANSRLKATPEESQAIVHGSIAIFGTYKAGGADVNPAKLEMKIEGSTFANWDGELQIREVTVTGDELRMSNPAALGSGTATSIWKRSKP